MNKELEALRRIKKSHFIAMSYLIDENHDVETEKALETIEQALKRNEPMKPLLKDMGFEHYDIYCPSCKEYIGFRNSVRQSLTLKYCPDCGQALDWSKSKGE